MTIGILTLLLGWSLWYILHNLLIANFITEFFQRQLEPGFRFYRLAFALFSLVTLIPLIHCSATLYRAVILAWQGPARWLPAAGLTTAALLFLAGGRHYPLLELLGIRQMTTGVTHRALPHKNRLAMPGVLGILRYPWYLATFLLLWSQALTRLEIQVNTLLSFYLVAGTLLEERKLVKVFGDSYRAYQRDVAMFFPAKWILAKIQGRRRSDES